MSLLWREAVSHGAVSPNIGTTLDPDEQKHYYLDGDKSVVRDAEQNSRDQVVVKKLQELRSASPDLYAGVMEEARRKGTQFPDH